MGAMVTLPTPNRQILGKYHPGVVIRTHVLLIPG